MNFDHYREDDDDGYHPPGPPGWFTGLGVVFGIAAFALILLTD